MLRSISKKDSMSCASMKSRWRFIIVAMLVVLLFSSSAMAAKNKLAVKVNFGTWGTAAQRASFISKLKAQLVSEFGSDMVDNSKTPAVTVKGVDIEVSEGTPNTKKGEVGVDFDSSTAGTSLGSAELKKKKCKVYPGNFTTPWVKEDLIGSMEKTAAHELGHMFCGDDQNKRTVADKMAQTWRRIDKAVGRTGANKETKPTAADKTKFKDANNKQKFSKADRIKMLKNMNKFLDNPKTNVPCDAWFPVSPNDTVIQPLTVSVDGEEEGMLNLMITPMGAWEDFDLGFFNTGEDLTVETGDDWFVYKWLGNREFDFAPGDPNLIPDDVITLMNESIYAFGVKDAFGNEYSLKDFGNIVPLDAGVYNYIYDELVYRHVMLEFDVDLDLTVDVSYELNADLSGLVADGQPAYEFNAEGSGLYHGYILADVIITDPNENIDVLEEGETYVDYQLRLGRMPGAPVDIFITTDGQTTVVPDMIHIEPMDWTIPIDVMIFAVDDTVLDEDETSVITHAIASGDPDFDQVPISDVTVDVVDNDCGAAGYLEGDINENCEVDLFDLAIFAIDWLECTIPYVCVSL